MGYWLKDMGGGNGFFTDFIVKAAITAGAGLVIETTATQVGEVMPSGSATTAADFVGFATEASTFNAAPTAESSQVTLENLTRIVLSALPVYRLPIWGGATAGTALVASTTTPANVLKNDSADTAKVTITDTAVGTVNMAGGLVKGKLGANMGAYRKLNAHTNSTSTAVGIAFLSTIAVDDEFIRVPYSHHVLTMQFTSDFTGANGIIATGTGAPFAVYNVEIDEVKTQAYVSVVPRDYWLSPESA